MLCFFFFFLNCFFFSSRHNCSLIRSRISITDLNRRRSLMSWRGGRVRGQFGDPGKAEPFVIFSEITLPDPKSISLDSKLVSSYFKFNRSWINSPYHLGDGVLKQDTRRERPVKRAKWSQEADFLKLDVFEKLEAKYKAEGKEEKEEGEDDEEVEESEREESDNGDYDQNQDFDDDDDDYNVADDGEFEQVY